MMVKTTNRFRNQDAKQPLWFGFGLQSKELPCEAASLNMGESIAEDPRIETLGDALKYFDLHSRLTYFETSLVKVRRNTLSPEAHESDFKKFDKEIQKLSFKYHPDKVKNRGGCEDEVALAQKLQTALNTTRTVLSVLNEIFLEDIYTDHKYGYYTKLNISSLGNEEEVKNHVYEVLFKISFISEIKQQNIIGEIRQFLVESKKCVKYFLESSPSEFEKCRMTALFHLKKCVKGHKKLLEEIRTVVDECRNEKLDSISATLEKMYSESSRNLSMLKEIKKLAKSSLSGSCPFYSTEEPLDEYFVLPFACYINVIVMCNVMLKSKSSGFLSNCRVSIPVYNQATQPLCCLYYLASFYNGSKFYKDIVERILGEKSSIKKEIKKEFCGYLENVNHFLEDSFKVNVYYIETNPRNSHIDEYNKCMSMVAVLKKKEGELRSGIKKLDSRNQEMEDKYAEAMRENEKLNDKIKECLEQSRLLREKVSASMSNQY